MLLTLTFVPLAALLPLIEPVMRLCRGEALPPLSAALSAAYLLCIVCGAVTRPSVGKRPQDPPLAEKLLSGAGADGQRVLLTRDERRGHGLKYKV